MDPKFAMPPPSAAGQKKEPLAEHELPLIVELVIVCEPPE